MFDTVQVIDTSEPEHLVIATFTNGIVHSSIEEQDIPDWFTQNLQNMTNRIEGFKSRHQ